MKKSAQSSKIDIKKAKTDLQKCFVVNWNRLMDKIEKDPSLTVDKMMAKEDPVKKEILSNIEKMKLIKQHSINLQITCFDEVLKEIDREIDYQKYKLVKHLGEEQFENLSKQMGL